jgi:hypothetical protein
VQSELVVANQDMWDGTNYTAASGIGEAPEGVLYSLMFVGAPNALVARLEEGCAKSKSRSAR